MKDPLVNLAVRARGRRAAVLWVFLCTCVGVARSQPCQDYACDSAVVRQILDILGATAIPVEQATEVTNGRITTLKVRSAQIPLDTLPSVIGRLNALRELNGLGAGMRALPPEIGLLDSLESLYLDHNLLEALPDEIGNLAALKSLAVRWNNLKGLPPTISGLHRLTSLSAAYNDIELLPDGIGGLFNLSSLSLLHNRLSTLPSALWSLPRLQWLDLEGNPFGELTPHVGDLRSLEYLNVTGCGLTALPAEVCSLVALEELSISGNNLVSFPSGMEALSALETLRAGSSALDSLPEDIGRIPSLKFLYLDSNNIRTLPPSIGLAAGLEKLHLQDNDLQALPSGITALGSLAWSIQERCHSDSFPTCWNDTVYGLDLRGNRLCKLPPDVIAWVDASGAPPGWQSTQDCSGAAMPAAKRPAASGFGLIVDWRNCVAEYRLVRAGDVLLDIFDPTGRKIAGVVRSRQLRGLHRAHWDWANLPAGTYVVRLLVDGASATRRTVVTQ